MLTTGLIVGVAAAGWFAVAAAQAEGPGPDTGVVSNVSVVSDKVADVSSIEAWKKSFIREGMSDREKALAVWRSVVSFQHQNAPPAEFLQSPDNAVLDPIKMFNVYGYSLCSVFAGNVAGLSREAGLTARNQTIVRHCVAEIQYEGDWHMLDASLVNYFPKPDGKLASVDEIVAATGDFYAKHPELKNNPEALEKFRKEGKWKQEGPALLAGCPFYKEDGLLVANWPWQCGWPETMREYDGSTQFIFEPGYSMGYRVNVQLRAGEKLTRNWGNKGLQVNMGWGKDVPPCIDAKVGEGGMAYSPAFGDLANGRIGNGVQEYAVPLAGGAFRGGALVAKNLVSREELGHMLDKGESGPASRREIWPALRQMDSAEPGVLVFRMPTSYVYLSGTMTVYVADQSQVVVSISTNNGLDWKEVATLKEAGKQTIDLKPFIFARYDYQVKLSVNGGIDGLSFRHDVQHSQRALPALAKGENTISFGCGNEGTVTVEGSTQVENKDKQLVYTDFHPTQNGMKEPMISVAGKEGWVEFPIETPAAMKRLRVFSFYRAKSKDDGWKVEASFDEGKTWREIGVMEGEFKAMGKRMTVEDVPAGVKKARVRFTGKQVEAALLFNVRIDADYEEPRGGMASVRVTYVWEEGGVEKRDDHVAKAAGETWKIVCAGKPVMKSLVVER